MALIFSQIVTGGQVVLHPISRWPPVFAACASFVNSAEPAQVFPQKLAVLNACYLRAEGCSVGEVPAVFT